MPGEDESFCIRKTGFQDLLGLVRGEEAEVLTYWKFFLHYERKISFTPVRSASRTFLPSSGFTEDFPQLFFCPFQCQLVLSLMRRMRQNVGGYSCWEEGQPTSCLIALIICGPILSQSIAMQLYAVGKRSKNCI